MKQKSKFDFETVPDRTNAEAPRHVTWTQAYEKCLSRQQISLAQLSKSTSYKTDYRTLIPV